MTDKHQPKVGPSADGAAKRQPMTPRSDTMETMTEREQIKVGDYVRWTNEHNEPWYKLSPRWFEGTVEDVYDCGFGDGTLGAAVRIVKGSEPYIKGDRVSYTDPAHLRRVVHVRTPVGDIPVIAYPTLRPDEFRFESGPWNLDADLREKLAGASDAPSADHPLRSEHRSKAFGYVTHENVDIGRALCAAANERVLRTPRPLLVELRKFGESEPSIQSRFELGRAPLEADVADPWLRREERRPDGFDQARIDEIKATLLATATGRKL